jgi:spore maturation protein CgeB
MPKIQFFEALSKKLSAKVLMDDGSIRHIHSTVKPEDEYLFYKNLNLYGNIVIFAGIGLGYHIEEKIKNISDSAICIVIDFFKEFIEHFKLNIAPKCKGTFFFISNYEDIEKSLTGLTSIINKPFIQIIKHPASYEINKDFYDNIINSVAKFFYTKKMVNVSCDIKKIFLFFGNHFLEQEVYNAFSLLNYKPVLFNYNQYTNIISYESKISQMLQEEKPIFVFSVNMKGFDGEEILLTTCKRFSIPIIVWFVDDPHPILIKYQKGKNDIITAFCWEKSYLEFLKSYGFYKVNYLPLGGDPNLFKPLDNISVRIPVGFVGTSMVDKYAGKIKEKFLWDDNLILLIDKMSNNLLMDPSYSVFKRINDVANEFNIKLPFSDDINLMWLSTYIIHYASMKKRKKIIESLLDFSLEIFGDQQGWQELLNKNFKVHPPVDYRNQLCMVYQNIKINLNITSCQMPFAVNQRVFDVPLSGSFVISDKQKDLFELFDKDEIAYYESIDDLRDKIGFYLKNDTERKKIIQKARQKILDCHTYKNRIHKILKELDY